MPYVLFCLVCLIWGSSFALMKLSTQCLTPIEVGAGRAIGGAAVLALFFLISRRRFTCRKSDVAALLAPTGTERQEMQCQRKAESRRNKYLAEWAAPKLGMTGAAVEDYIKAVRKADLASKGDDDVLQKLKADFAEKGVKIADAEIRKMMDELLAKAVAEVEATGKS